MATAGVLSAESCWCAMKRRTGTALELEKMNLYFAGTTDGMRWNTRCERCRFPAWLTPRSRPGVVINHSLTAFGHSSGVIMKGSLQARGILR
jgi:hypothetical protein